MNLDFGFWENQNRPKFQTPKPKPQVLKKVVNKSKNITYTSGN